MNNRYIRQQSLIGEHGQYALSNSTVLVVGAGGIGNIATKYLASSGVGTIIVCDYDYVEKSNLNRQILFNEKSVGNNKADSLCATLNKINSGLNYMVIPYNIMNYNNCNFEILHTNSGKYILHKTDIILDCADNMKTSYYLEELALKNNIPLIFAKTSKFFGVITFIKDNPYLRKNYPRKQLNKDKSVFPPIGGVVGSIQASLALKHLVGLKIETNKMFYYDLLNDVNTVFDKS